MSRKIEQTPSQASLFSELKKLSKRANQRIVRLERYSEDKEPFAVKQLADYLSSSTLNSWTKTGRVATKRGMSELQMKSIIKAMQRFLNEETSTVSGAKQYTQRLTKDAGKIIPPKLASSFYQAEQNYKWIYQYMTESEFWDFARECVSYNISYDLFSEKIKSLIDDVIDESMNIKIQLLYRYIQGVKI